VGSLLIMLMAMWLEGYLINLCAKVNGPVGLDKVVLTTPIRGNSGQNRQLNLDAVSYLQRKLPGHLISYLIRQDARAEANGKSTGIRLLGTNYLWSDFTSLILTQGGMWTAETEGENQRVALIDADLANQLFGSANVVGMNISILGEKFLIAGVYQPPDGMLAFLIDDGTPEVYIPGTVLFELAPDSTISQVQIDSTGSRKLDSPAVSSLIAGMGLDPTSLAAFDYRQSKVLMEQVPALQLLIMGILIVAVILQTMWSRTSSLIRIIRNDCRDQGLGEVLKIQRRRLAFYGGFFALSVLVIILIWQGISFNLYIPARYIPEDLIDISHFTEVIKQDITEGQRMMNYCQPRTEQQLGVIRPVSGLLYCLVWPLGLGAVLWAWPRVKQKGGK